MVQSLLKLRMAAIPMTQPFTILWGLEQAALSWGASVFSPGKWVAIVLTLRKFGWLG